MNNKTYGPLRSGKVSGGGWAVVLAILFWAIFYMNLPWSLDGFAGGGSGPPTEASINVGDRFIKIAMIVLSLCAILARWSTAQAALKNVNLGLAALLVMCPLSAAWSIDSSATIMRFVSLISIVLLCFAISVCGWHRHRLQQLSVPPLVFILVGSLIVGMIYPDRIAELGTDVSQKNAWHGIAHGKNEFGMFASMGVIFFVNGWLAREGRAVWNVAMAAISFTCLVLSRSNTSMLSTLVGVGAMFAVMKVPVIRRSYSNTVMISIASVLLLYELVIQNVIPGVNTLMAPITSLTGKDATFSARTIIWNVIKEHIQGAPYLGSGYGAYWTGPLVSSPSYVFIPLMSFYPTEAHNGYLDIVNDLGLVGLMFLLLFLLWYLRQGLQLMRFDCSQAALYIALLFQEMVINMSESDLFSRTSTFAILLLAATSLSRALTEARGTAKSAVRAPAPQVRARSAQPMSRF